MKNRVTKKAIIEGAKIIKKFGYWSQELRDYLYQFTYSASNKLSSALNSVYNSCQPKASIYYTMLNDLGLIEGVKQDRIISTLEQQRNDENFVKNKYKKIKNKLSVGTLETIVNQLVK